MHPFVRRLNRFAGILFGVPLLIREKYNLIASHKIVYLKKREGSVLGICDFFFFFLKKEYVNS